MSQFLTSTELFINVKNPPQYNAKKHFWDQSPDVLQFWMQEAEKLRTGTVIGGYKIHPWLYWHINFFKTPVPQKTGKEKIMCPPLDDNMLYIIENYAEAEERNLGLALFGTRGFSKSTLLASLATYLTAIQDSGVVSITGGSDPDLKNISRLIRLHHSNINPAFKIPTVISDWDKQVLFGVKEDAQSMIEHSKISITNADPTKTSSTEKGAGSSPIGYILDECGKFPFLEVFRSAIPSFKTQYGYKLVPILSGTSGNMDLAKDAKKVFTNPEDYKLLPINWDRLERYTDPEEITWAKAKPGNFVTFVPGQMSYRLEAERITTNLSDLLGIDNKSLKKIEVQKTDWKAANKELVKLIDEHKDEEERKKNRMYYPREVADVWLTMGKNPFPKEVIDKHKRKLEDAGKTGRPVEIFKQDNKYQVEFSAKEIAPTYYNDGEVDAPVLLYTSFPEVEPAKYTYTGGLDSYKLDGAAAEGSLGSLYVLKRRNLEVNQPCETIAASYTARTSRQRDFNANCEKVIRAFNAETCIEAVDLSFQQYMDERKIAEDYLCKAFTFTISKANKKPSLNSRFGLYPTEGNNRYRMQLFADWCREEHTIGIDEDRQPIIKLGVEFIEDIDLLQEMLDYKPGGNYDRIAGFSHALVLAKELDKAETMPERKKDTNKDFSTNRNSRQDKRVFTKRRTNPF